MASLRAWWRSWRLRLRVRQGKQSWGRQTSGQVKETSGGVVANADMPAEATMSARVYRAATDSWEDLGVIGTATVSSGFLKRLRQRRK